MRSDVIQSLAYPTASCLPWVPEQGTVGASGDLAPLSHLALGLMGEGHMWSPNTGWGEAKYVKSTIFTFTFVYGSITLGVGEPQLDTH